MLDPCMFTNHPIYHLHDLPENGHFDNSCYFSIEEFSLYIIVIFHQKCHFRPKNETAFLYNLMTKDDSDIDDNVILVTM